MSTTDRSGWAVISVTRSQSPGMDVHFERDCRVSGEAILPTAFSAMPLLSIRIQEMPGHLGSSAPPGWGRKPMPAGRSVASADSNPNNMTAGFSVESPPGISSLLGPVVPGQRILSSHCTPGAIPKPTHSARPETLRRSSLRPCA